MQRITSIEWLLRVVFLVLITIFITSGPVFSETTINGNPSGTPSRSLDIPARFVLVMNNEAVLDRETGLVWERDAGLGTYNWQDAITHCYNTDIGGRGGWRLPTIAELTTLVDKTQTDPALPAGHPFINVQSSDYWSSTTAAAYTNCAWRVHFYKGDVYDLDWSLKHYVRAVRSGQ